MEWGNLYQPHHLERLISELHSASHSLANEMGTEVSWIQILMVGLTTANILVLGPLAFFWKRGQDRREEQLKHLDECLDNVRSLVMSKVITREELEKHRADMNENLTRIRAAISSETHGLHDRIMRIENQWFNRSDGPYQVG